MRLRRLSTNCRNFFRLWVVKKYRFIYLLEWLYYLQIFLNEFFFKYLLHANAILSIFLCVLFSLSSNFTLCYQSHMSRQLNMTKKTAKLQTDASHQQKIHRNHCNFPVFFACLNEVQLNGSQFNWLAKVLTIFIIVAKQTNKIAFVSFCLFCVVLYRLQYNRMIVKPSRKFLSFSIDNVHLVKGCVWRNYAIFFTRYVVLFFLLI